MVSSSSQSSMKEPARRSTSPPAAALSSAVGAINALTVFFSRTPLAARSARMRVICFSSPHVRPGRGPAKSGSRKQGAPGLRRSWSKSHVPFEHRVPSGSRLPFRTLALSHAVGAAAAPSAGFPAAASDLRAAAADENPSERTTAATTLSVTAAAPPDAGAARRAGAASASPMEASSAASIPGAVTFLDATCASLTNS